MNRIKDELPSSEIQRLNEENLFDYIRTYTKTRNSELVDSNGSLYVLNKLNGVSMLNNCVFKIDTGNKNDLEKAVEDILGKYSACKRPVYWYISPAESRSNLESLLKSKKLMHVENYSFMHMDIVGLNARMKNNSLRIKQVSDLFAVEHFLHVYCVCFELSKDVEKELIKYHSRLFLDPLLPAYHYIGYVNGKPVGTSTVFYSSGIAGIYNITVLPEARNLGVGSDMTIIAMNRAKKDGFRYAVLQATQLGSRVYTKIGFEAEGIAKAYVKFNGISVLTVPVTFVTRKAANCLRGKLAAAKYKERENSNILKTESMRKME